MTSDDKAQVVLFAKGSRHDEVWDDSALIKAFDKAMKEGKEKIAKRLGVELPEEVIRGKKGAWKNHPNKKRNWSVGAPCRAVFSEDGNTYEASIQSISKDGKTCVVRYVGYDDEEEIPVSSLLRSRQGMGKAQKAQAKQETEVLGDDTPTQSSDMESQLDAPPSSQSSKKKKRHHKRHRKHGSNHSFEASARWLPVPPPQMNGMNSMPHANDFRNGVPPFEAMPHMESFLPGPMPSGFPGFPPMFHHGFPSGGAPPMVSPLPPPPPMMMNDDTLGSDDEALSAMLMAWYMSGYHTGYYNGLKHGSKKASKKSCDPCDCKHNLTGD